MAEYIDLEAAEYRLEKMASIQDNHSRAKGIRQAARYLREMVVSAELEPVRHGKWLEREVRGSLSLVCSECLSDSGTICPFDFCPNCGAKMDMVG